MKRFRAWIQRIFMKIDKMMTSRMGTHPLPGSPYGLIHLNYIYYKGKAFELPDGTRIEKGDQIGELHFSNTGISSGKFGEKTITSDLQLLSISRSEITLLSSLVKKHAIYPDVKAYYSMSLFGPGAKRLGFTLRPVKKSFRTLRITIWMSILRRVFSPDFVRKTKKRKKAATPCEIWISRKTLMEME